MFGNRDVDLGQCLAKLIESCLKCRVAGTEWVAQLDTVLPYSLKGRALALICCSYLFSTSYHFMCGLSLAFYKVTRIAYIFTNAVILLVSTNYLFEQ